MFESFLGVNPWTSLFILMNTLTIFFVAKKHLFQPVMKIITERQQEIDKMYTDAGSARQQAQELQAEYQQKLSAAQLTSERIVKEAVARGQRREEEILRKAKEEATAVMSKASADIAQEKKKAISDAKNEISVLAITIAGKVIARELNHTLQKKLIDGFIDGLGDSV